MRCTSARRGGKGVEYEVYQLRGEGEGVECEVYQCKEGR